MKNWWKMMMMAAVALLLFVAYAGMSLQSVYYSINQLLMKLLAT